MDELRTIVSEAVHDALAAVGAIRCTRNRANVLAALTPHLSEPMKERTLLAALEAARAIRDEGQQAKTLAGLTP